jgi:hypothetical protein
MSSWYFVLSTGVVLVGRWSADRRQPPHHHECGEQDRHDRNCDPHPRSFLSDRALPVQRRFHAVLLLEGPESPRRPAPGPGFSCVIPDMSVETSRCALKGHWHACDAPGRGSTRGRQRGPAGGPSRSP